MNLASLLILETGCDVIKSLKADLSLTVDRNRLSTIWVMVNKDSFWRGLLFHVNGNILDCRAINIHLNLADPSCADVLFSTMRAWMRYHCEGLEDMLLDEEP
jgi:hypothetical protein